MARMIFNKLKNLDKETELKLKEKYPKVRKWYAPIEEISYHDLVLRLARVIPVEQNQREKFIELVGGTELGDTEMKGTPDWFTDGPNEKGDYRVIFVWTPIDKG